MITPPRRLLALFSLTLAVVSARGLSGCGAPEGAAHAAPPAIHDGENAVPVTLAPVVRGEAHEPVRATGRVTHDRDVRLAFKTGGVVAELLVDEGDSVAPGQVIARLDRREIDAGVSQARSALAKARRDLSRAEGLAADAVLPPATAQDAETAVAVARAQLAGARFNQETATLEATAAGVVLKRLAEPGEVVGPGQPVLVVGAAAEDGQRVDVAVPAGDSLRLAVGDRAQVVLDGVAAPVRATVVELAPALTPGTGQRRATLRLEPSLGVVLPPLPRGLAATATITPAQGAPVAYVPATTLVDGDGRRATIWLLDGDHPVAREVRVGWLTDDGRAAIVGGLDGVDRVIDAGNAWLSADARVTVATAEGVAGATAR
ncbi:MAG: efflux RND transporter periplasmic adaptor subunit [Deltaproteobacteria bacterium]|nr:efflux RND transporter periplasmic adaptor subunit [Deltaproteobacteria bacterium]